MENATVDVVDEMIMASIDFGADPFIQVQEPVVESDEKTFDPEKVIASVSAIAERVARLSVEEGIAVDTKTTPEWDFQRFNKANKNPILDEDDIAEPLKLFELTMLRSPSTAHGFVSCDENNPRHPTTRIVPRGVVCAPLENVMVATHGLPSFDAEAPKCLGLDNVLRQMGAKSVRADALVRVETAFVPDKGMKNRCLEISKKTLTGSFRVLVAHSHGIESLGYVSDQTEGTLKVGIADGGAHLSFTTTNDNMLKIWGQCNICRDTSTLGPTTMPYEVLQRGSVVGNFTCRHFCTRPNGERASLLLRRKGARILETMLLIYVPVLSDAETQSLDEVATTDATTDASPPKPHPLPKTHLHPGKELTGATCDRDLSTINVDSSRRVHISAIVLFGVSDPIVSRHDVPMPLHPSDSDIRAALWVSKSLHEDLGNGTARLHVGTLPAKKVIRVHCVEQEEPDDADRPFGKRRKLS